MSGNVSPVPEGFHTVNAYLSVRGAAEAIDFYTRALGAVERYRMPGPGGAIMHAEIQIGDSVLMLADENPEQGSISPATLGGTPVSIMLYVEDVDAAFEQAVGAGGEVVLPPTDMFWGDRFCKFNDPFGHNWAIATHTEDLTPEEIGARAQEAFAEPAG